VSVEGPATDRPFGSLSRRTAAGIADILVLGVGITIFTALLGASTDVRFVAQLLQAAYWIVPQSRLGSGQTIGKRLFDLRVVTSDGGLASLGMSAWRWFVAYGCSVPLVLALQRAGTDRTAPTPSVLVVVAIVPAFAMLADSYLLLANRSTRRTLHDLVSRTVVVRAEHQGALEMAPLWLVHRVIVGALAVVTVVAVPPTARWATAFVPRTLELMAATTALRADPRITSLGVVPTLAVDGRDTVWTVHVIAAMNAPHATVAQQDSAGRAIACAYALRAPRAVAAATVDLALLFNGGAEPIRYEVVYAPAELTPPLCASLLHAYPLAAPAARPIR
jgi:uncharacterized RDD family membrane protein YckC